jgi:TolB-like protein
VLTWAALAIGVIGLGVAFLLNRKSEPPAAPPKSVAEKKAEPTAPLVNDKSIAVLPFTNMSDEKEASAFFSDGVQEDILTNLANIREFRIVPRTSVEQYRGTKKKLSQIAQELRVAYILQGSVRRAGEQVRVTGQLINARTDENVWAKSYDRNLTNVLSIQAELATDIAQAMKTALSSEEKALVERRPTVSTAAYEQFLKAREARRGFGNTFSNAQAMEPFLLEAVRLDPNYSAAYAELVYVYTIDTTAAARQAKLAKAQAAVDHARRLAPDSPEVILALGDFYLGSGDTGRALEHYERFGRLRPKDPDYLARLAETYQRQGKGMELKTWEIRKQLEDVDPGNLSNLYRTVNLLAGGRRYAEAIAVQRRIWTRLPDNLEARHYVGLMTFWLDGSTQLQDQFWSEIQSDRWERGDFWRLIWLRIQGRLDEAVNFNLTHPLVGEDATINVAIIHGARGDLAAARARLGDLPDELRRRTAQGGTGAKNVGDWSQLGTIEGVLGDKAEALRCAARVIELSPAPRVPTLNLARLCAWAGDKDAALAELGQYLNSGASPPAGINNVHTWRRHPDFFPLQGDSRFEALLNDPKNNAPLF